MKKFLIVLTTACSVAACNQPAKDEAKQATVGPDPATASVVDEAKKAIAESNMTYGDGFMKGDSSLFISHYTSDGCIMPPGAPKLCGKEGLAGFFNVGTKQMGVKNIALTTDEVFGSEEAMVEVGQYELFSDSAKTKSMDKGKFIVVWKKEEGKWKMHRDIFNSLPPAQPAAAPAH